MSLLQEARKKGARLYRKEKNITATAALAAAPPSITDQEGYALHSSEFSANDLDTAVDQLIKFVEDFEIPQ